MSKKDKKKQTEAPIENYYDLKTDKIDELVEALKSTDEDEALNSTEPISMKISDCTGQNTPDTKTRRGKDKEFDPYRIDKFSKIPVWLRALFIKFWFAGCVCYFVMFGLSVTGINDEDLTLLCGVILGIIVDIMVNPIFRMLNSEDREFDWYTMFPFPLKAFWTFFANAIYYLGIMLAVTYMYTGLNLMINSITGSASDTVSVAVEPLLFGVFAVIADMACIGIKDLIVFLVRRGKRRKVAAAAEASAEQLSGSEDPSAVNAAESAEEADGEPVDEVEKLRRLAESQNAESAKGANSKHKKQK